MAEMITGAREWIELDAPAPIPGGVMSVANVVDTSGHGLMGVEALSDACATAEEWVEWCTMEPSGTKEFAEDLEHREGDPFAVYTGVSCLQRLDDGDRRARTRLGLAESRAVDLHIAAELAADASLVDLGGPFPLPQAIGAAEAFAATVYGGAPTLLIPRLVVPCGCANGLLRGNLDGSLSTCSGSRVAPITTSVTVPIVDDTAVMYVTGSITILRGPVQTVSVPQQIADDGSYAPMRALAERIYVPIFDCLVAKVEVTCS
jgi:hypothetical protein